LASNISTKSPLFVPEETQGNSHDMTLYIWSRSDGSAWYYCVSSCFI